MVVTTVLPYGQAEGGRSWQLGGLGGDRVLPTFIKALCPTCGEIDVRFEDATLEIHGLIREGICRFACPRCRVEMAKPVPPPMVEILVQVGVHSTQLESAGVAPPPLTGPDLLRFQGQLKRLIRRALQAVETRSSRPAIQRCRSHAPFIAGRSGRPGSPWPRRARGLTPPTASRVPLAGSGSRHALRTAFSVAGHARTPTRAGSGSPAGGRGCTA